MTVLYSDINSTSPTEKSTVYNLESINQSINTILSTRKGERIFNLDFGVNITEFLFDLMDELSVMQALDSITDAIETYEPRVKIDFSSTSVIPYPDDNKLELNLVFEIKDLNDQKFSLNKVLS